MSVVTSFQISFVSRFMAPQDDIKLMTFINAPLTLNIPRGVLRGPPLVCYWLTSVEINKHKIFDTNNA